MSGAPKMQLKRTDVCASVYAVVKRFPGEISGSAGISFTFGLVKDVAIAGSDIPSRWL
jgi:hypothetical protein